MKLQEVPEQETFGVTEKKFGELKVVGFPVAWYKIGQKKKVLEV